MPYFSLNKIASEQSDSANKPENTIKPVDPVVAVPNMPTDSELQQFVNVNLTGNKFKEVSPKPGSKEKLLEWQQHPRYNEIKSKINNILLSFGISANQFFADIISGGSSNPEVIKEEDKPFVKERTRNKDKDYDEAVRPYFEKIKDSLMVSPLYSSAAQKYNLKNQSKNPFTEGFSSFFESNGRSGKKWKVWLASTNAGQQAKLDSVNAINQALASWDQVSEPSVVQTFKKAIAENKDSFVNEIVHHGNALYKGEEYENSLNKEIGEGASAQDNIGSKAHEKRLDSLSTGNEPVLPPQDVVGQGKLDPQEEKGLLTVVSSFKSNPVHAPVIDQVKVAKSASGQEFAKHLSHYDAILERSFEWGFLGFSDEGPEANWQKLLADNRFESLWHSEINPDEFDRDVVGKQNIIENSRILANLLQHLNDLATMPETAENKDKIVAFQNYVKEKAIDYLQMAYDAKRCDQAIETEGMMLSVDAVAGLQKLSKMVNGYTARTYRVFKETGRETNSASRRHVLAKHKIPRALNILASGLQSKNGASIQLFDDKAQDSVYDPKNLKIGQKFRFLYVNAKTNKMFVHEKQVMADGTVKQVGEDEPITHLNFNNIVRMNNVRDYVGKSLDELKVTDPGALKKGYIRETVGPNGEKDYLIGKNEKRKPTALEKQAKEYIDKNPTADDRLYMWRKLNGENLKNILLSKLNIKSTQQIEQEVANGNISATEKDALIAKNNLEFVNKLDQISNIIKQNDQGKRGRKGPIANVSREWVINIIKGNPTYYSQADFEKLMVAINTLVPDNQLSDISELFSSFPFEYDKYSIDDCADINSGLFGTVTEDFGNYISYRQKAQRARGFKDGIFSPTTLHYFFSLYMPNSREILERSPTGKNMYDATLDPARSRQLDLSSGEVVGTRDRSNQLAEERVRDKGPDFDPSPEGQMNANFYHRFNKEDNGYQVGYQRPNQSSLAVNLFGQYHSIKANEYQDTINAYEKLSPENKAKIDQDPEKMKKLQEARANIAQEKKNISKLDINKVSDEEKVIMFNKMKEEKLKKLNELYRTAEAYVKLSKESLDNVNNRYMLSDNLENAPEQEKINDQSAIDSLDATIKQNYNILSKRIYNGETLDQRLDRINSYIEKKNKNLVRDQHMPLLDYKECLQDFFMQIEKSYTQTIQSTKNKIAEVQAVNVNERSVLNDFYVLYDMLVPNKYKRMASLDKTKEYDPKSTHKDLTHRWEKVDKAPDFARNRKSKSLYSLNKTANIKYFSLS
jgi:hypothetical protein